MAKPKLVQDEPKAAKPTTIKAFSVCRVASGWSFLIITLDIESGTVLDVQKSEPTVKAIAINDFRTVVGKHWMDENAK